MVSSSKLAGPLVSVLRDELQRTQNSVLSLGERGGAAGPELQRDLDEKIDVLQQGIAAAEGGAVHPEQRHASVGPRQSLID